MTIKEVAEQTNCLATMEAKINDKIVVNSDDQGPVQPSRELKDFKWFYIIGGTLWSVLILIKQIGRAHV